VQSARKPERGGGRKYHCHFPSGSRKVKALEITPKALEGAEQEKKTS